MSQRTCEVEGCSRRHRARGKCCAHYNDWRRESDPRCGRPRTRRDCEVCGKANATTRRVCNAPAPCRWFIDPTAPKCTPLDWRRCTRCNDDFPSAQRTSEPGQMYLRCLDCRTSGAASANITRRRHRRCCGWCGCWFSSGRPDTRHCSYACKRAGGRVRRKARERGAPGTFDGYEWAAQLRRYGRACAYCGSHGDLHHEHVVPLIRGGTNRIANVVPACLPCNSEKGAMTPAEWLASDRARVASGTARPTILRPWPVGEVHGPLRPLHIPHDMLDAAA